MKLLVAVADCFGDTSDGQSKCFGCCMINGLVVVDECIFNLVSAFQCDNQTTVNCGHILS